ncbi:tRNA (adenine(22)-N(1))-methyltransferase [Priestia taiwanensis]|uniref:SAM-dependent methyltransferase n=1 Tax=Priestia taiwanensis TaxID=1347902 RepID=A0A917EQT4_9BACI|nr:tRNA (adenine(22)-N(1))-methyltransferase TrmK [Priestia taiwanensis]MBM7363764.1 tRNA (adenine22-N1)-methyltransferase [Priestia taiwanensis]GGE74349.1 SAM-dependent methyltransferase [Priestia taiwanensis]
MNEVKLSKRLEMVVHNVPTGAKLADIGSDHAYLPCYAILNNIASYAIAGEVVEGPFQSACTQVRRSGLTEKISVRKGSGLQVLEKGEVDAITIAGMGGALIRDILEDGKEKLEGVTRLILQPNIAAYNIREWFIENGWELKQELILKEDKKIYEILVGERGNPLAPYSTNKESEIHLGPFLMNEKSDVFVEKWQHELVNLEHISKQLEKAVQSEETAARREEVQMKVEMIKGVIG